MLIEIEDQRLSVMVVVDACAGTDRGFSIGRVGDRETGGKVILCLRPKSGLPVMWARGRKLQVWLINLPGLRSALSLQIPRMGVDGRSDHLAIYLIGRLQDGMTNTESDRKVWLHAPCILHVPFELVGLEIARDGSALGDGGAGRRAGDLVVEIVGDLRNGPDETRVRNEVGVLESSAKICGRWRLVTEPIWVGCCAVK